MGILGHGEFDHYLQFLVATHSAVARFIRLIGGGETGILVNDFFHNRNSPQVQLVRIICEPW